MTYQELQKGHGISNSNASPPELHNFNNGLKTFKLLVEQAFICVNTKTSG